MAAPAHNADILMVDEASVRALLPWDRALDASRAAFEALGQGKDISPTRHLIPDGDGLTLVMPGKVEERNLSVKVVSTYPGNTAAGLPGCPALINVVDRATGLVKVRPHCGDNSFS